ncbi:hypothetical protein IWW34DRAFT_812633 [Fusarium oxysporum f. sp. albedinis]|nr:hypothetical protein IWW34DRAFT_812633 [Fusarium oxysporum f. sp. albedinis]
MPGNSRRKPEISTQLDRIWEHDIWNHLHGSKGNWPVMERQGSPPVGTQSGPIGGQSTDVPLIIRACQGSDGKEGAEDGKIDDENVEAWELEDEDDEDDDDDYDDSGYTESFLNGQPSSTLLIYFSGILGFSADCQRFQLARQYCSKLSAMIYIQRILFLERALPLRRHSFIGIAQRPEARHFECSQYKLAELISLRDFGRNIARTEPPSMLFHWSNDCEIMSHSIFQVTMNDFRKLPDYFLTQADVLCDRLMFGMHPNVDLMKVKDDMASSKSGYSFIKCTENGLEPAYLELLLEAKYGDGTL